MEFGRRGSKEEFLIQKGGLGDYGRGRRFFGLTIPKSSNLWGLFLPFGLQLGHLGTIY